MKHLFFSALILACMVSKSLYAEKTKYLEVLPDGTTGYITLSSKVEKLIIWTHSKGNISSHFEFLGTFPSNAKVQAFATRYRTPVKEMFKNKDFFWPIKLNDNSEIEEKRKNCIELGLGDKDDVVNPKADKPVRIPKTPDFDKGLYCKLYPWPDLLKLGVDCYPHKFFATFTKLRAQSSSEYFDLYGLLRRDACGKKSDDYVVKIEIDLRAVLAEDLAGFTASARIKELTYPGKKRATLKPKSDGRYAPKPIILMEWMNGLCGNELTMTKWSRAAQAKPVALPLYSFYLHQDDLILAIAVVDKVLKGGKGTFELSDGYQSYGVCMELVKKRQRVNGYR